MGSAIIREELSGEISWRVGFFLGVAEKEYEVKFPERKLSTTEGLSIVTFKYKLKLFPQCGPCE